MAILSVRMHVSVPVHGKNQGTVAYASTSSICACVRFGTALR